MQIPKFKKQKITYILKIYLIRTKFIINMKIYLLLAWIALLNSASYAQKKLKKYQTINVEGHLCDIALPLDTVPIKGNLMLLPGWNFPKEDWCLKSSVCKKALQQGYRLILPEMGKSTYQSQNYPETRKDWLQYPTRKWLTQKLIPYLQDTFQIFKPNENNFILGLSTGARGVLLITIDLPDLFRAAAALSGDYDQTLIPQDGVMRGYYGEFKHFPERWKTHDNVIFLLKKYNTPLYIGHGKQDKIIPYQQSEILFQHIQKIAPDLKLIFNLKPNAGHDYTYWDSEVDSILQFFKDSEK